VVLYLVWGPALVAWGLWVASVNRRVQPAVLGAILAVVMSGLVANLMLVQFVQYGPSWITYTLQVGAAGRVNRDGGWAACRQYMHVLSSVQQACGCGIHA
jgi:hypothetical protein